MCNSPMRINKLLCFLLITAVLLGSAALSVPVLAEPNQEEVYPLIVVGSEPEAITAAVSAARNGVKTLLLAEDPVLGGLMTRGRLNFLDMNYGPEGELLTRGIFEEFFEAQGNAFDIAATEQYFLDLVEAEPNITLKLNAHFLRPLMEDNKIIGVVVEEGGREQEYRGERIIDATADADVAAAAGVPYTVGTEDYGVPDRLMGATLVFRVRGVSWLRVFLHNNFQRLLSKLNSNWGDPAAGATWQVAWGYGIEALDYQARDPQMRFRGPNLARQDDGTVLINALLIFGVDALEPESSARGIERGKAELPYILEFMRERFVGFRKVELVDVAEELYVRETRHIMGEYRLTIDDVLENWDQWDRIAHGSYPVDIQPAAADDLGNVIGKPAIYSIPFRSIVPLKVDNLLVVTRSASYDSLPHGSARVLPIGMAVGEAAGVATAYSLEHNKGFREMSRSQEAIRAVQDQLKAQGAYLVEYEPPRPAVMEHWAYEGLKVMRRLGLAAGGYANDYRLDQPLQYWDATYLLNQVIKRANYFNHQVKVREITFSEGLTWRELLSGVVEGISGEALEPEAALEYLQEKGLLASELEQRLTNALGATPTFGEIYVLLGKVYEHLLT